MSSSVPVWARFGFLRSYTTDGAHRPARLRPDLDETGQRRALVQKNVVVDAMAAPDPFLQCGDRFPLDAVTLQSAQLQPLDHPPELRKQATTPRATSAADTFSTMPPQPADGTGPIESGDEQRPRNSC